MSDFAFTIDHDGDRAASDGVSRYGFYLRDWAHNFAADSDGAGRTADPAEFAVEAFLTALPPIMSPGYVRQDPRVQNVGQLWDDDRRPAVTVTLVSAVPPVMLRGLPTNRDGWRMSGFVDRVTRWEPPYEYKALILLPTLQVIVPLADAALPTPTYDHMALPDLRAAQHAVRVLVTHLNTHLAPILEGLAEAGVA